MPKKAEPNEDIEQLQVGVRIRHARVLKGLRMRDLAERVGYDESMISKVEALIMTVFNRGLVGNDAYARAALSLMQLALVETDASGVSPES